MSMIILASASPRRKEILETIGLSFEIIPAKGEEVITSTIPSEVVLQLSEQKALEVASNVFDYSVRQLGEEADEKMATDTLVIGADTVVAIDEQILGKPVDEEDAIAMLTRLSGRTHKVYTGVTLVFIDKEGKSGKVSFCEETIVSVAPLTEKEIRRYVASGDPLDKAGSYGIQGPFSAYVERIEGDYQNVVGFPVARFYAELKKLGIDILEW